MMIRQPATAMPTTKEVKVRIPVQHHVRLHSMKVLTGKQISDTVSEALRAYFESSAYKDAMKNDEFLGIDP